MTSDYVAITPGIKTLTFGNRTVSTDKKAFIMGIVNATPDSFFSGSRGGVERAEQLIAEGADILDIGGESTRPGFSYVSAQEEIRRIVPVIRAVRKNHNIPISIDTTKFEVLKAAYEEGADVYNDISSFESDDGEKCAGFVAEKKMSVILMHRFIGKEEDRKTNPFVTDEVCGYLESRISYALNHGIQSEKIIIDPGIGFGKTFEENVLLIRQTEKLCSMKGCGSSGENYPLLMALSRKRCIGTMTGREVEYRMIGSVAANMLSVIKGASIVRVHDVAETVDALNILKYIL